MSLTIFKPFLFSLIYFFLPQIFIASGTHEELYFGPQLLHFKLQILLNLISQYFNLISGTVPSGKVISSTFFITSLYVLLLCCLFERIPLSSICQHLEQIFGREPESISLRSAFCFGLFHISWIEFVSRSPRS